MSSGSTSVTVATYNVHGWVGTDCRSDPDRTLGLIASMGAQVVGLQEVKLPIPGQPAEAASYLEHATGMEVVTGPTLFNKRGSYGNVLLSRFPVLSSRRFDLSYRHREPRGVLDVDLDLHGCVLRVIVTHLGLQGAERHWQIKRLVEVITAKPSEHMVLMGDFNDWLFFSRAMRDIHDLLHSVPAPKSFPSRFPLLSLDRIWVRPSTILVGIRSFRGRGAPKASDHLPVLAELVVPKPLQMHQGSP